MGFGYGHAVFLLITCILTSGDEFVPTDLLDVMMSARDEVSGVGLSSQELVDEVITIMTAGHEVRPSSHKTWSTSQQVYAKNGIHCVQWECSHSSQAIQIRLRVLCEQGLSQPWMIG